jgi:hypothetical protein
MFRFGHAATLAEAASVRQTFCVVEGPIHSRAGRGRSPTCGDIGAC